MRIQQNDITNSSSLLLNVPSLVNITTYKKNKKITKFVLLSELVYMIIIQTKNYKKLHENILKQINYIKKKLFILIKEELERSNRVDLLVLKNKLVKTNVSYDSFVDFILSDNKGFNASQYLRKHFRDEIENIKLNIKNKSIYIKYIYLKKIITYLNRILNDKLDKINFYFYKLIHQILKNKNNRIKLKILITRILKMYTHKGLNIELSRQRLQRYLLKCFKKSSNLDYKYMPNSDEADVRERNVLSVRRDNASTIKEVLNYLVKHKYGFSYFKFYRELKARNLENVSIIELFKLFDRIENNTLFGIFKNLNIKLENKKEVRLFTINNVELNNYRILRKNNIYFFQSDYSMFNNKDYYSIYNLYNFFNSLVKRKKYDNFLSVSDKLLELFSKSYLKYVFFNFEYTDLSEDAITTYSTLNNIYTYMNRHKLKKIRKQNLSSIYIGNSESKFDPEDINLNMFMSEYVNIHEVIKKKKNIEDIFTNNLLEQVSIYMYKIKNIYLNHDIIKSFSLVNVNMSHKLLNVSENLNQIYIYSNLNTIFFKYFTYLRHLIRSNNFSNYSEVITILHNRKISTTFNFFSNYFSNNLISKDDSLGLKKSILKAEDNYSINEDINLNISKYLLKLESNIFNKTLVNTIPLLEKQSMGNTLIYNKETIINRNDSLIHITISELHNMLPSTKKNISIFFRSNLDNEIKLFNLQESFNSFFFKRLVSFNTLLKLSKKETRFLIKNNTMFFLKTKNNFTFNDELDTERLMKINYSFLLDDYNRVLSSIIVYTTTELEKITKFQTKRKQFNRIY
jgi:hypothetical protein